MYNRILLVEDSQESQKIIESSLSFKYKLDCVDSISAARLRKSQIENNFYDLILLDILLPDGTGFDLCREMQSAIESSSTPVFFLTAKDSLSDKLTGFSLGADDYVTKPFDSAELLVRIDSKILKSQKRKFLSQNIVQGPIRLNISCMSVYLQNNDQEKRVDMTPVEFKLLLKLIQSKQKILSRQELMDSVWGGDVYIEDRSIDKHISAIRKKINPFGDFIKTVYGIGYEFKA